MGNLASQPGSDAAIDDDKQVSPQIGRIDARTSLSRRAFVKWGALSAGAAAVLGRLVGFAPSAGAVTPGNCVTVQTGTCFHACAGPCRTGVSRCSTGVNLAQCACPVPGRCGTFFVSATCTPFTALVCCFSCA
jgi:hypothetical protein